MISAAVGKVWFGTRVRTSEWMVVSFFVYTAVLATVRPLNLGARLLSLAAPLLLVLLATAASRYNSSTAQRARDWAIPASVLTGYWQMGWFAQSHDTVWQKVWLSWDRRLLDQWGLRILLEHGLPFLPWLLELSYLLLYLIPPACLVALYQRRAWNRIDRYLLTFAAGTLVTYALLPVIPVESPRLAFAAQDLPAAHSAWRDINVWILDRLDISTSVFPSGHVAVAFSSAFGIKRALPDDLKLFAFFLALACSVYLATIYGRYHYAVDGLASIIISLVTWGVCDIVQR